MTTPEPLDSTQLGAYFALIETSSLLRHAVEQQLRDAGGLSYVQFQLLASLDDAPGRRARMTDLADGIVFSRSGLTYQAQALEKRGLVTRTPSADDERSIDVALTDEGHTTLRAALQGHVALVRDLFYAPLTPDETATLGDLLSRVRDHMRQAPPRSAKPRRTTRPSR